MADRKRSGLGITISPRSDDLHHLARKEGTVTVGIALAAEAVWVSRGGRPVLRDVSAKLRSGGSRHWWDHRGRQEQLLRRLKRLEETLIGRRALSWHVYLRGRVGMTFQKPVTLPGTVADNIRYGMDDEVADSAIEAAAALAGVAGSVGPR